VRRSRPPRWHLSPKAPSVTCGWPTDTGDRKDSQRGYTRECTALILMCIHVMEVFMKGVEATDESLYRS